MRLIPATLVFLAVTLSAQPGGGWHGGRGARGQGEAPIASLPIVEISGVVDSVHISPGQGMPYLEVKGGSETTRLYLGAMHYLIAENFNPKAGQQVTAKGYRAEDGVIGITVTLTGEKKTLKLRDEHGRPLWRGGPAR